MVNDGTGPSTPPSLPPSGPLPPLGLSWGLPPDTRGPPATLSPHPGTGSRPSNCSESNTTGFSEGICLHQEDCFFEGDWLMTQHPVLLRLEWENGYEVFHENRIHNLIFGIGVRSNPPQTCHTNLLPNSLGLIVGPKIYLP